MSFSIETSPIPIVGRNAMRATYIDVASYRLNSRHPADRHASWRNQGRRWLKATMRDMRCYKDEEEGSAWILRLRPCLFARFTGIATMALSIAGRAARRQKPLCAP